MALWSWGALAQETPEILELRSKLIGLPVAAYDGPIIGVVSDMLVRDEKTPHGLTVDLNPDIAPRGGNITLPWGWVRLQIGSNTISAPWTAGAIAWAANRGPTQGVQDDEAREREAAQGVPQVVPPAPLNDKPIPRLKN